MVTPIQLVVLIVLAELAAGGAVLAQTFEAERRWLGPLGDIKSALIARPSLPLAPLSIDPAQARLERMGFAAFRAPDVLGEAARRAGLSCQVCHPGGGANRHFFIEGASSRPGTFDATSALFSATADDGRVNPLAIPGLGGVARTGPFGHRGDFKDLAAFTRHAIVEEFGGDEPDRLIVDALAAYMSRIGGPINQLDSRGRLPLSASDTARAGEAVFHRPFPGRPAMSCATCHEPTSFHTDRARHDVGTGGAIDTPSLRRGDLRPPYMHDGRFDRLEQVVRHFDGHFGLDLAAEDRANLVAYLESIGGAGSDEPVTLAGDLGVVDDLTAAASAAIEQRAADILALTIASVRRELGLIHERFFGAARGMAEARAVLVRAAAGFREVGRQGEADDWVSADDWLRRVAGELSAAQPVLETAAPDSLYDHELLSRALAGRPR